MSTDNAPKREWVDPLRELISSEDERKLRAFQCACCRLIEHKLPVIAQQAVQLGEDYNNGLVEPEVLKERSQALVQYLEDKKKHLDADGTHWLHSSISASAYCVFVGPIDIHAALEYLEWGTLFCNRVENHWAEQEDMWHAITRSCDFFKTIEAEERSI